MQAAGAQLLDYQISVFGLSQRDIAIPADC